MNRCCLAVWCRHKRARSEFELNHCLMDASGHNAIEIHERSTLPAELGKLLRRGRWRIGVVNHLSAFFALGFIIGLASPRIVRATTPRKRRILIVLSLLVPFSEKTSAAPL